MKLHLLYLATYVVGPNQFEPTGSLHSEPGKPLWLVHVYGDIGGKPIVRMKNLKADGPSMAALLSVLPDREAFVNKDDPLGAEDGPIVMTIHPQKTWRVLRHWFAQYWPEDEASQDKWAVLKLLSESPDLFDSMYPSDTFPTWEERQRFSSMDARLLVRMTGSHIDEEVGVEFDAVALWTAACLLEEQP